MLLVSLLLTACIRQPAMAPLDYPTTRRGDTVDPLHGVDVADPYRWLEAPGSEETQAWISDQNTFTSQYFAGLTGREAIRERLASLWRYESYGTPYDAGERLFYTRRTPEQEQAALYVQDRPGAQARVLLDPNTFSEDNTVSLAGWTPSEDGQLLAYAISDGGSDWRTWRVLDVTTGEHLQDELRWMKFSGVRWAPDGSGLYYSRYPQPDSPLEQKLIDQRLYFHALGTPQDTDQLLYEDPAHPEWGFGTWSSEDGDVLLMSTWRSTEEANLLHRLDPANLGADPVPLFDDWSGAWRPVTTEATMLYLWTNKDAPNGRLVRRDLSDLSAPIEEVLPESDAVLQSVRRTGDVLFASYLRDAQTIVQRYALDGTLIGEVTLPGVGTVYGFRGKSDDTETYYTFTNFITPATIYRYTVETDDSELFRRPEVDFDPDDYIVEQVFYGSKDGTRIPMFIAHRKDVVADTNAPTLLYGYGGFNISIRPGFSVDNLVWMEMGGVYASANLRGGGEYGEAWHLAGTKTNKQNVFDDFIFAAEHLIDSGWTRPARLAIHGRSNGGLLVGATLTQRPDLFGAAIPSVGVLDMLRYHQFTIGRAWASDYGTVDDKDEFAALYAYSPVHNAHPAAYPATLVTTADRDDRVVPAHSYKFAAALQHAQIGPEPVLIRIDTRAGHGAGRSITQRVEERADMLTFLANELEMELPDRFSVDAEAAASH
ncbi:MAG: prolyl oligopeptidase family serine peptidase [Myxococcota bacterium]